MFNKEKLRGGYIPLDESEMAEINRDLSLDFEIWDTLQSRPELDSLDRLQKSLNSRYRQRKQAVDSLMILHTLISGEPAAKQMVNLDFIHNFFSYFYIGNKGTLSNICSLFGQNADATSPSRKFQVKRRLASGAVGTVYLLATKLNDGRDAALIVKEINAVQPAGKYLSLFFSHFHSGHLRWHPASRIVELDEGLSKNIEQMSPNYFKTNAIMTTTGSGSGSKQFVLVSCANNNFVNQTILHLIIEKVLGLYRCCNFLYQYDAFFCRHLGYLGRKTEVFSGLNITEFANGGTLDQFINNILAKEKTNEFQTALFNGIFTGVLTALRYLKQPQYAFVHGDLKSKNVLVQTTKEIEEIMTSEDIENHVTCKIADFDKSSITWHKIRFHNDASGSKMANISMQLTGHGSYLSQITDNGRFYSLDDWFTFFKTQYPSLPATELEQIGIRYLPYPFYGSIDIYTLTLSLLTNRYFVAYVNRKINVDSPVVKMLRFLYAHYTSGFSQFIAIFDSYIKKHGTDIEHTGEILDIAKKNHMSFRKDVDAIYALFGITTPIPKLPQDDQGVVIDQMQLSSSEYKMCTGECGHYRRGHVGSKVSYSHTPERSDELGGEIINFQPRLSVMSRYPDVIENVCSTNLYSRGLWPILSPVLLDYDTCQPQTETDEIENRDLFVEVYNPELHSYVLVSKQNLDPTLVNVYHDEKGNEILVAKSRCDSVFDTFDLDSETSTKDDSGDNADIESSDQSQ